MRIDVYYHVFDPFKLAVGLCQKIHSEGLNAAVLLEDKAQCDAFNRRLWVEPPDSFIPHCLSTAAIAESTPIWLHWSLNTFTERQTILLNLSHTLLLYDEIKRFSRLLDVVGNTEEAKQAGRARWSVYRKWKEVEIAGHDRLKKI